MTTIEKMVRRNSGILAKKFTSEERVREFEKIAEEFEELVKKRMINKKGSRLSSITDAHIYFNVSSLLSAAADGEQLPHLAS